MLILTFHLGQFLDQLPRVDAFLHKILPELEELQLLSLLSDDEIFLDIDPSKTVVRFSATERVKKFGKEDSPEYTSKVKAHRDYVTAKLAALTGNFIQGIRGNLHCFPPSLARLLRSMHR